MEERGGSECETPGHSLEPPSGAISLTSGKRDSPSLERVGAWALAAELEAATEKMNSEDRQQSQKTASLKQPHLGPQRNAECSRQPVYRDHLRKQSSLMYACECWGTRIARSPIADALCTEGNKS